eukprot:c13420_g1_i2.p1 GENE.c13420_g1_i2~~c13420_g1_i2.p1  ORF type:complete len:549 (+),score=117.29 c13420_g1_i2:28-1674(+)
MSASVSPQCTRCASPFDPASHCPRFLQCGHVFCAECLTKASRIDKQKMEIVCPQDKTVTIVAASEGIIALPRHVVYLNQIKDAMLHGITQAGCHEQQVFDCGGCEDLGPHPATHFCQECAQYICNDVISAHKTRKLTRTHTIVEAGLIARHKSPPPPSLPVPHDTGLCQDHPTQPCVLYDVKCDHVVCKKCVSAGRKHFGHECKEGEQATQVLRGDIKRLVEQAQEGLKQLKVKDSCIAFTKEHVTQVGRDTEEKISKYFFELHECLHDYEASLVSDVQKSTSGILAKLQDQQQCIENLVACAQHCIKLGSGASDNPTPASALTTTTPIATLATAREHVIEAIKYGLFGTKVCVEDVRLAQLDLAQEPLNQFRDLVHALVKLSYEKFDGEDRTSFVSTIAEAAVSGLREGSPEQAKQEIKFAINQLNSGALHVVQAGVEIRRIFKHNQSLKSLTLDKCAIGDVGCEVLAGALRNIVGLSKLYLYSNDIGDRGAIALGHALKSNDSLILLRLAGNRIGEAGAVALAEGLSRNQTLKDLVLGWGEAGHFW